jgi:DNA repair photolyase
MNHKPVFGMDVKAIINLHSKFEEKLLCEGPTFSAGTACAFSCAFCYVEGQFALNSPVQNLLKEHDVKFDEIVIRRKDAVGKVRAFLTRPNGKPRYLSPSDTRVIYSSPLVDVAANMLLVLETIEICREILTLTNWQIRLLSKSNLLPQIAKAFPEYKDRLIFGVSTGTLDDKLAAAFERGTALVGQRLKSLHWLQDNGYRTFGMICPSLPQDDYEVFASEMAEAIRVERCEHVWAEPMNVRGASLNATIQALHANGRIKEATDLAKVSGPGASDRWEAYARATFLAHANHIPHEKLRFMQYVDDDSVAWWRDHESQGTVLLGKAAERASNPPNSEAEETNATLV